MVDEELTRLLGVRDGLAHALISVGNVKSSLTGPNNIYLPPSRHCRKRQNVLNKIAELDKVSAIIRRQLEDVKLAITNRNQ